MKLQRQQTTALEYIALGIVIAVYAIGTHRSLKAMGQVVSVDHNYVEIQFYDRQQQPHLLGRNFHPRRSINMPMPSVGMAVPIVYAEYQPQLANLAAYEQSERFAMLLGFLTFTTIGFLDWNGYLPKWSSDRL